MSTHLSAEDMARANITQNELDEYDAYMASSDIDPLNPTASNERNTMPAKYAIDAHYKQFDEATGLPAYPKNTAATETRLRNAKKKLQTTQARVEAAIDRALEQFEAALDHEDRKRSTQQRLEDMTRTTRRIN